RCATDAVVGAKVTFNALPTAESAFIGWRGAAAGCGRALVCSLVITGDLTIGARFARRGTAAWAVTFAGLGLDGIDEVVVDREGNTIAAVYFTKEVTFGGVVYPSLGNAFALIKLTPAGDVAWVKSFNPLSDTRLLGLAIDPRNGDLAIWGSYEADF